MRLGRDAEHRRGHTGIGVDLHARRVGQRRTQPGVDHRRNVPWVGHENTVIASVKNSGSVPAPGVIAKFYVRDFGTGGPEVFIGEDTHDVATGP